MVDLSTLTPIAVDKDRDFDGSFEQVVGESLRNRAAFGQSPIGEGDAPRFSNMVSSLHMRDISAVTVFNNPKNYEPRRAEIASRVSLMTNDTLIRIMPRKFVRAVFNSLGTLPNG